MNAVNSAMPTSEGAAFLSQTIHLGNIGLPLPKDDKDTEYKQIVVEADLLARRRSLYGGTGATLSLTAQSRLENPICCS